MVIVGSFEIPIYISHMNSEFLPVLVDVLMLLIWNTGVRGEAFGARTRHDLFRLHYLNYYSEYTGIDDADTQES